MNYFFSRKIILTIYLLLLIQDNLSYNTFTLIYPTNLLRKRVYLSEQSKTFHLSHRLVIYNENTSDVKLQTEKKHRLDSMTSIEYSFHLFLLIFSLSFSLLYENIIIEWLDAFINNYFFLDETHNGEFLS